MLRHLLVLDIIALQQSKAVFIIANNDNRCNVSLLLSEFLPPKRILSMAIICEGLVPLC